MAEIKQMPEAENGIPKLERSQEIYENYIVKLINRYHGGLAQAKIAVLLRKGKWSSKNRDTWGSAKKVSADIKALYPELPYDFIITLNRDIWEKLNEKQRFALTDHQLSHCFRDDDAGGDPKYSLTGHDYEEFNAVIRRHGVWSNSISQILRAVEESKQMSLWDPGEAPGQDAEVEEAAVLASGQ